MTGQDGDQDAVTIRIPRRAAAIYAADLEVSSGPFMVALNVYGQMAAGIALLLGSIVSWVIASINYEHGTYEDMFLAVGFGVVTAAAGTLVLYVGQIYRKALRTRGVLA